MSDLPEHTACRVVASTIDDLMRAVVELALTHGEKIEPRKGPARDLTGVTMVLTTPRARLSRSEGRGKAVSAIAELCWYLAGSDDLEHIKLYLPAYAKSAEADGQLLGAYGPRLFGEAASAQIERVVSQLRQNPSSRQAVAQVLRPEDLASGQRDVPCTIALQFLIRNGGVTLVTSMRSNDILWGVPHDVFAFTMMQELVACALGMGVGPYIHNVGSLHLYESSIDDARAFLREGYQPTDQPMPDMPMGEPWDGVRELLAAESSLRGGADPCSIPLPSDPYWRDLATMLAVRSVLADARIDDARALMETLSAPVYRLYVEDRIDRMTE